MPRSIDADSQIGRRLRLRDLHLFFTVIQRGSMAKAAADLGISQPAVSEVIADLEHTLGVRLFDRSSRGVEPTKYGLALLKRGRAAFDELKQGVRDIEFLSDPAVGEVTVGYRESIAITILPQLIERFSEKYPRVVIHADGILPHHPGFKYPGLYDRTCDLVFGRQRPPSPADDAAEELNEEVLFDDPMVIVAGAQSQWAHRRKIDLADLIDAPWILSQPNTATYDYVVAAFRARGLDVPATSLVTYSNDLRAKMAERGRFITAVPRSVLHGEGYELKILPVDVPVRPWPVVMFTLKNRTLSPVVERFIECARDVAKTMEGKPKPRRS